VNDLPVLTGRVIVTFKLNRNASVAKGNESHLLSGRLGASVGNDKLNLNAKGTIRNGHGSFLFLSRESVEERGDLFGVTLISYYQYTILSTDFKPNSKLKCQKPKKPMISWT
jgi:hypothetical protein